MRTPTSALASLLLALPLAAQSQFRAGDLYLSSRGLPEPGQPGNPGVVGVLRVEPFTGASSTLLFDLDTVSWPTIAFDPYRDRLLLSARIGGIGGLWAVDAAGNAVNLIDNDAGYRGIAPTGDGRVYLSSAAVGETTQIRWLDAGDVEHVLLDVGGAQPFSFDPMSGIQPVELVFDGVGGNLIATSSEGQYPCPGGAPQGGLNLRRLPLTAAGDRLAAAPTCVQHQPSLKTNHLHGTTPGPDGWIAVGTWGSSGATGSEVFLLDPATLQVAPYSGASPSPHSVVYSRTRGRAVVLNTGLNTLSLYGPGETGFGTTLATEMSAPGTSGELASLVEIAGAWPNSGLTASTGSVSVGAGGAQILALDVDDALAGEPYLVLGSTAGWTPALPFQGALVPLVPDAYAMHTLAHPNAFPLASSLGVLGAGGTAQAAFALPPGSAPVLIGLELHHAALVGLGPVRWVTNPVPLALVP